MTIAAGFCARDGVLLCADTLMSGLQVKTYGNKIKSKSYPFGNVAFALSGDTDFALAAIAKCERALDRLGLDTQDHSKIIDALEKVLVREYKTHVLSKPDWRDRGLCYRLLIGIWTKLDGVALYSSSEGSIKPCESYECHGIGLLLGNYLEKSVYSQIRDIPDVIMIAANIVAQAKKHVEGCGGRTQILILHKNGEVQPVSWLSMPTLDDVSERYREAANWFQCDFLCKSDSEFAESLETFISTVRELRNELGIDDKARAEMKSQFERHRDAIESAAAASREADRQFPELTKGES